MKTKKTERRTGKEEPVQQRKDQPDDFSEKVGKETHPGKNTNGITELVFLLDASGSMYPLAGDTVGGFNSLIEEQRRNYGEGSAFVTTVLFNSSINVLHDRVPLAEIEPMKEDDYRPSGCTSLTDALGCTVSHIRRIHQYIRPEDVPEKTIFIITTDGMENASRFYSADEVRNLLKTARDKNGWEFVFLGANIDAVETAEYYGIDRSRAAQYVNDSSGTAEIFRAAARAIDAVKSSLPLEEALWNAPLK